MRVASIDIGTNTVLLLVAERDAAGTLVAVREEATITRLGEGVDVARALKPEAIARTNACLSAYAAICRELAVEKIDVVGTSAMRDAGGGDAVREHVQRELGVPARTISGDEEARLTFRGALSGMRDVAGDVVVFDIGGGSTEIVSAKVSATELAWAKSFDIGSVRLTERHLKHDPPSAEELTELRDAVRAVLRAVPALPRSGPPVGIAGTVTTLAAVSMGLAPYDGARVHGFTMSKELLTKVVRDLAAMPQAERKHVRGLEPKRADVIVAGGHIALGVLDALDADAMRISDRGVRWGLADELARQ
jgi:exopolyphosphatase/guanosine-5'-triphosphate,3'-diphosphate pyrophosphatase